MVAPAPDEALRLESLSRHRLIDPPTELLLDELAQLAAFACGTTSSVITLVDDGRQWFEARFALDLGEPPRELAFGAHTVVNSELMIIPDALLDSRWRS